VGVLVGSPVGVALGRGIGVTGASVALGSGAAVAVEPGDADELASGVGTSVNGDTPAAAGRSSGHPAGRDAQASTAHSTSDTARAAPRAERGIAIVPLRTSIRAAGC